MTLSAIVSDSLSVMVNADSVFTWSVIVRDSVSEICFVGEVSIASAKFADADSEIINTPRIKTLTIIGIAQMPFMPYIITEWNYLKITLS